MTMHASSLTPPSPPSPAPAITGTVGGYALPRNAPAPQSPPPSAPPPTDDGEPLFNTGLLRDLLGFVLGAVSRRRRAALGAFVTILGTAFVALLILPRSYYTETRLLAQRNVVMPVLGNPGRNMPAESDTPTRLASEAILNYPNLVAIINSTNLPAHWRAHRSIPGRVVDKLKALTGGSPSPERQVQDLAWLLRQRMWVNVGEGTVTIGITWPDPDMAYRLVQTAQENFIEQRHSEELALISESIGILEARAAEVNEEIAATLDSMARDRAQVAAKEGPPPLLAALRRAAPSPQVMAAQQRLETVRRTIADLEQYRTRRLAEMQAALADQRNVYGPAHPQIESTLQLIAGLQADSPQLLQLRHEEQQLRERLGRMGAEPAAPASTTGTDPLLAAAALRSLNIQHTDSLVGEKQQYSRSRLRISIASFEKLLERLDAAHIELETTRAAFKYKYGVLVPPQRPDRAVSPRPTIVLGGGIVLGIALAVFVALALDVAGGRVVEPWQIERSLGLPVLAKVPGA